MKIVNYNKYSNRKYMRYRRNSYSPVLEVIDEIDIEVNINELLLEENKILQKQIEEGNNKLTLFERAIMFELHYWMGIL
jgi:hypothetical protein